MMNTQFLSPRQLAAVFLACLLASPALSASEYFATTVIDYHPGETATLTNSYAAVGRPGSIVGAGSGFDGIYSPFNPHYEAHHLAQIGEGGDLTLRLERPINVTTGMEELGIFTNVGLIDGDFPNGLNVGSFGIDDVTLDVSPDGVSWVTLGTITCDFPASAHTDAPTPFAPGEDGLTPAHFNQAHDLVLADLDGKSHAEILALLDGSAGGKWIDLSPSLLETVQYVRFRVPDDLDPSTQNTFELAALTINTDAGGPVATPLSFLEEFTTNPIGTRASSDPGHADYTGSAVTAHYDLSGSPRRTVWLLGQSLTDEDSFSYSVDFSIDSLNFPISSFGQLSFGLINSVTTGSVRTMSPSDSWDLLTIDYFPSEDVATLTPTVIGSQMDGQTNAFENLGFPSGSASLINEGGEVGQLPTGTPLHATVDYDASTRILTLRLQNIVINSVGANPDGDNTTIQYTVPARIKFSVDSFALLCWQEPGGGSADLTFTNLQVTTPAPAPNYYSWADANISAPLDRAPHLDANADGLSNLLDYALGGVRPTTEISGNLIRYNWQVPVTRDDVIVRPQLSRDLAAWNASPFATLVGSAPGLEFHEFSRSISTGREFVRLHASRP